MFCISCVVSLVITIFAHKWSFIPFLSLCIYSLQMAPATGRGSEKGQQAQGASLDMPLEQDVVQGHSNQSPESPSSYLNLDQGDARNISVHHPETQASDEPKPRKGQGHN